MIMRCIHTRWSLPNIIISLNSHIITIIALHKMCFHPVTWLWLNFYGYPTFQRSYKFHYSSLGPPFWSIRLAVLARLWLNWVNSQTMKQFLQHLFADAMPGVELRSGAYYCFFSFYPTTEQGNHLLRRGVSLRINI